MKGLSWNKNTDGQWQSKYRGYTILVDPETFYAYLHLDGYEPNIVPAINRSLTEAEVNSTEFIDSIHKISEWIAHEIDKQILEEIKECWGK